MSSEASSLERVGPPSGAISGPSATGNDADYRVLANALPQIIWTTDASGRLEWVNDRWYEFTGLTEEESLYNKGALAVIHPDDQAQLERTWRTALETSTACEIEYRIRRRDGVYRWHLARAAPVRGANGVITRWVSAVMDMHERRMAEEALRDSERRFEAVFNVIPQATAIIRLSDGFHMRINEAFTRLTGFTPDDVAGQSTVTLGIWTAEERAKQIAPLVTPPGGCTLLSLRTKDGRPLRLAVSSAHVNFGGDPCMITVGIDVSAQEEAESALRAADRRKDEFLALLSHELRNPIAPILFSAQVLKRRADAEAHVDLDVIIRQAQHLARLVDDLLDVSMVARGKVTLAKQRIELSSIVARAMEVTAPLLEKAGHQVHLSVPSVGLTIDADEVRLTQVLNNLLANAARYTPPEGIITISAARERGVVVLRVRDSGVGIDPSFIPDLFEMFVQGESGVDRAQGGLGLGLALVRSLTELHGGTVSVLSDGPGRGSEFIVRLPAAEADRDDAARPPRTNAPSSGAERPTIRVLVVDDNRDVAVSLARLLALDGHETRIATDPLEALAASDVFRPHVAILDIGLPTMDGYTLARELRALLRDAPPALIALTGYGRERDRQRSQEAGFSVHLVKPVDFDELAAALETAVGAHRTPIRNL